MGRKRTMGHGAARIGATAGLLAALLAGACGSAHAETVVRDESIGCSLDCQDTFEVRCTQSASVICVGVGGDSQGPVQFIATAVVTAPAADRGRVQQKILGAQATRSICFSPSSGSPKPMRALVSVAALGQGTHPYRLVAECYLGAPPFLETRGTKVTRKQNE
jgi:hypothetical protein